jgi:hypothetical protein
MIDAQGWFDWAIKLPGVEDKVYSRVTNACIGVVPHSMEGSYEAALARLFSTERDADGRYTDYAAASWIASNCKDGRFVQHYSVFDCAWTSGSRYPNTHFVGIEHEGVAGEPLTDAQVANLVRAIREIAEFKGWEPRRPTGPSDMTATLYEHNECTRWGSAPTACPSGRIPWDRILEAVMDAPTKAEFGALFALTLKLQEAVRALGGALFDLARHTYGDVDPRVKALEEQLKVLQDGDK